MREANSRCSCSSHPRLSQRLFDRGKESVQTRKAGDNRAAQSQPEYLGREERPYILREVRLNHAQAVYGESTDCSLFLPFEMEYDDAGKRRGRKRRKRSSKWIGKAVMVSRKKERGEALSFRC